MKHPTSLRKRLLTAAVSGLSLALVAAAAFANPLRVDLRPYQSGLRDQNPRNSCNFFAVTAAVEAAYRHSGYVREGQELDLSEEFFNFTQKMFSTLPYSASRPPWIAENLLGPTDGGSCVENLQILSVNHVKLPLETAMPYVPNYDHIPAWTPWLAADLPFNPGADWSQHYFTNYQFNTDHVNLNPAFLPVANFRYALFYGIDSFQQIDGTDTTAIENALAANHEVVVLLGLRGDPWLDPLISDDDRLPDQGGAGHCILIVGYDRNDPINPYFIVKNSAQQTSIPGANGYQYVSYRCIHENASHAAGYVTGVSAPTAWPQLQFLGRWDFDFDGGRGVLDIHHLPGTAQLTSPGEHRVGTFFAPDTSAFRVNGFVSEDNVSFWLNAANPQPRYDEFGGRQFTFYLFRQGNNTDMAGFQRDPDGAVHAGYARKGQGLLSGVVAAGPVQVSTYYGTWNVNFDGILGRMDIRHRDDTGLPTGWAGLYGTISYALNGVTFRKTAWLQVNTADPSAIHLRIQQPDGSEYALDGRMLSSNPGVIAGAGSDPWFTTVGFYANRLGESLGVEPVQGGLRLSWPQISSLSLQCATTLGAQACWLPLNWGVETNDTEFSITLPRALTSLGNLYFRLGPPPALTGQPDLVVTKFVATGSAVVSPDNTVVVPVRVIVKNQGAAPAGMFKLSVEYKGPKDTAPRSVAFSVPGQSDTAYPWSSDFLSPGAQLKLEGTLCFSTKARGQTVVAQATADSGAGDALMPPWNRVLESDEGNNQSANLTLMLP